MHGAYIIKHFLHLASPMAMMSGKVTFVLACGALLRRFETVLELIAVPFEHKIARTFSLSP